MPVEIVNSNGNSLKAIEPSSEIEPEDRFGWNQYYPHLREQINQETRPEGKEALRELYERRKEVEQLWLQGKIKPPERSDRKFEIARKFRIKHEALFDIDEGFSEAISIIRDETA